MSDNYNTLQNALEYIEKNLKEDITIEELSKICMYSSTHFKRLFLSIVGVTPIEYIKKRKLASAAWDIIEKEKSLLDIALDYGFKSQEVFTRAFKRTFDITPNGYRKLKTHAIPRDYWRVSFQESQIQMKYMKAVENLCLELKKDKNILGVILLGSLSYDKVWIKSDIELAIVVNDGVKLKSSVCLIVDDIYVYGKVYTRTEFVRNIANSVQGSETYSTFANGTLLYSYDDIISDCMEKMSSDKELGDGDKHLVILRSFSWTLNCIYKAEKWLKIKSDPRYSYLWILKTIEGLAEIEVLITGEVPKKEVVLQALKIENRLFEKLYIELMDQKKNSITITDAIESVYEYIRKRRDIICKPLLEYFDNVNDMKSVSTILKDFNTKLLTAGTISEICEWLCEEGYLVKDYFDTRITKRSSVLLSEPGYFKMDMDTDIYI